MRRYHPLLVSLHWLMALMLLLSLAAGGLFLANLPPDSPQKLMGLGGHMAGGMAIGVLLVIRLATRVTTTHPPRAQTGSDLLDRIGIWTHRLFYVLIAGMVLTGLATAIGAGLFPIVYGGCGRYPPARTGLIAPTRRPRSDRAGPCRADRPAYCRGTLPPVLPQGRASSPIVVRKTVRVDYAWNPSDEYPWLLCREQTQSRRPCADRTGCVVPSGRYSDRHTNSVSRLQRLQEADLRHRPQMGGRRPRSNPGVHWHARPGCACHEVHRALNGTHPCGTNVILLQITSLAPSPGVFLVRNAELLEPGCKALAIADGEGRNSVFMARRGLRVTAMGQFRGRAEKGRNGWPRPGNALVDFRLADLRSWEWEPGEFDLVVAIFIQFADPEFRSEIFDGVEQTLKPVV